MVKHNNQVPNIHCHKKYLQSSRGPLKVKVNFNQATRKKARRLARAAKAAAAAPAPVKKLRPVVHCPTQKYSSKVRLGRGFTIEELKAAGLHPKYAMSVGIAIDWRRQNKSQESLDANVARLEEYKSKLVILKKGDAAPGAQQLSTIQPIEKKAGGVVFGDLTPEVKEFKAFTTMREARQETRVAGFRKAVENRKDKK